MSLSPVGGIRRVHAAPRACYTEAIRQRGINSVRNSEKGEGVPAGRAGKADEKTDRKPFFVRAPVPVESRFSHLEDLSRPASY